MELKKDSSPPVYRTILNMELPKWAKHQALKDIERMPIQTDKEAHILLTKKRKTL